MGLPMGGAPINPQTKTHLKFGVPSLIAYYYVRNRTKLVLCASLKRIGIFGNLKKPKKSKIPLVWVQLQHMFVE
jgi:hypothetical protein